MNNQAFSKIGIIVILAILIISGIIIWQSRETPKKEAGLPEETALEKLAEGVPEKEKSEEEAVQKEIEEAKLISFEIVPSCESDIGWILYPEEAKAIARGKNLSKVEFWLASHEEGIEPLRLPESQITKRNNQWELPLSGRLDLTDFLADFYVIGYDNTGKQVGKISLGYNSYTTQGYPEKCK